MGPGDRGRRHRAVTRSGHSAVPLAPRRVRRVRVAAPDGRRATGGARRNRDRGAASHRWRCRSGGRARRRRDADRISHDGPRCRYRRRPRRIPLGELARRRGCSRLPDRSSTVGNRAASAAARRRRRADVACLRGDGGAGCPLGPLAGRCARSAGRDAGRIVGHARGGGLRTPPAGVDGIVLPVRSGRRGGAGRGRATGGAGARRRRVWSSTPTPVSACSRCVPLRRTHG